MKKSLYSFYFENVKKYKEEFKTDDLIVLIQVGSFYEFYEIGSTQEDKQGDAKKLAGQLNLQIGSTDKSKEPGTISNPFMCGFPVSKLETKYKEILINQLNYTVVIISQTSDPPNPTREVTEILSPSVFLSETASWDSNFILTLFIEELYSKTKGLCLYSIGMTAIDTSTGEIYTKESTDTIDDDLLALEESYRFIHKYKPKEIQIYCSNSFRGIKKSKDEILQFLELESSNVKKFWDDYSSMHHILDYQNTRISSVFNLEKSALNLSPIESIGLELYPNAIISLTLSLQFVTERSKYLLNYISKPKIEHSDNELILDYNCSKQLNIVSETKGDTSLFDLLKVTCTAMGNRELRSRLLTPIKNVSELEYRYNLVEIFKNPETYKKLRERLIGISDISRLFRRISLQRANLTQFLLLKESLEATQKLLGSNTKSVRSYEKVEKVLTEMLDYINKVFVVKFGILEFKEGVEPEIDTIKKTIDSENSKLEIVHKLLNDRMLEIQPNKKKDSTTLPVKLEFNERDGYYFLLTKIRFNLLKKNKPEVVKHFTTKPITNSVKFYSDDMISHSTRLSKFKSEINTLFDKRFKDRQREFHLKFQKSFDTIIQFVCEIDISTSIAMISEKYSYNRPVIVTEEDSTSFIEAKQIRHPIVERILKKERYTPNDIELTDKHSGILLFGLNMCGKSTLMKAVGLSVVMAQAGMYIAAKEFKFCPFDRILTRISDGDNILKGMSTFAVEMTELNTILERSTRNSLVIGDEICHGTEQYSGSGIVGASLIHLSKKNVKFLFATHLHNLSESKRIKEIQNLKTFHLEVCNKNGKLVYIRKLQEGSGESTYGIEVAEAMGLKKDFIELAKLIRKEESGESEFSELKVSKYNSKLKMEKCQVCLTKKGTYTNSKFIPLETHHILFQCNADNKGKHDSVHKNELCNLVVLCRDCHQKVHQDKIKIEGYKLTSNGMELEFVLV